MNADKIRDSILLYAVKGALVHQDANDIPASVLIKEIEKEKAAMVSDGRIKKPIKSVPFTEKDELFDVPKGWVWCRLGDLLAIVSDGTHHTPKYVDAGVPFLSVQNISSGYLDTTNAKYISEEEHRVLIERIKPQLGDILLCRIGTLGKAIEVTWDFDFSIFVSLGVLRPIDNRLTPYILRVINSPWGKQWIDRVKVGGGTHTNKINLSDIPTCPIPLPPLEEQKRILAKVTELFSVVDEYDKAAEELKSLNEALPDKLRKSVLQNAIYGHLIPQDSSDEPGIELIKRIHKEKVELVKAGKLKKKDLDVDPVSIDEYPFEKPAGWEFARLSEISLDSADGPFGSNLKKEHYTNEKQVRIIQLSNIGEFGWRDSNVKYTTFEHLKTVSRSEAFAGDIIIAKMMPAGRAIICPNNDPKYVLSSDAVRFAFSSVLDKKFLYYAINSPMFKEQVYGEVQGITRVRTSLSKLRTYILPIPPLSEQQRIVAKIEEVFANIDKLPKSEEL